MPPNSGLLSDEIWDRVRAVMGAKAGSARRVYDAGQTHQDSWGWKVSAYLWTKSIAAGALILAPWASRWDAAASGANLPGTLVILSLIFLALTGALLVADLKRPDRFLWVLTRPQWDSWLTRGSYILLAFGAVASGLAFAQFEQSARLWNLLAPLGVVIAAAAAAYTAFLFWQSKGRDLWQSPLLPVHLVVQAVVAGLSVTILAQLAISRGAVLFRSMAPQNLLRGSLVLNAALLLLELMALHQTEDASRAARWARSGPRLHILIWGVLVAGQLAPLILLGLDQVAAQAGGAVLALIGLALYEHLYVRAGQSVPLS
jgi:formate-dependent nitrite reductase membrane component NrfD